MRAAPRTSFYPSWIALAGLPLLAALVLPVFGLLGHAVTATDLRQAFSNPLALQALQLSALTTATSLAIVVVFGTPIALVQAHRRLPGGTWLDSLLDLPMVLPPAVAGLALLLTFGRRGSVGGLLAGLGLEIPFTTLAVVLAQVFVAAPFFLRAARIGFASVSREIEEAAAVDGATPWQTVRFVSAPIAGPALAAGAILAWARALGEFGATIMFAGNFPGRTQTMPLAIYGALESDLGAAVALSVVLLIVAYAILLAIPAISQLRASM